MIITTLVENTSISKDYKHVHGLSFFIETRKHKLLFDLGPGKQFYENALKMNIDIEDIDAVIISHGHYDHGGALKTFLEKNKKAKIYISEAAFGQYYLNVLGLKFDIGLDQSLKDNERLVFTKDAFIIDDELQLFSNVSGQKYINGQNKGLYKKIGKQYIIDTFRHEQNLLIHENDTYTMFAGCAHCGIINILEKAESITGTDITTVFGGFHLMDLPIRKADNRIYLKELAKELGRRPTKYYTCHCTSKKPYELLHKEMGSQIFYTSTGNRVNSLEQ